MFIAALFTIAKKWKQSAHQLMSRYRKCGALQAQSPEFTPVPPPKKKTMRHICNKTLLCHKK
jgi:hypothetical protein